MIRIFFKNLFTDLIRQPMRTVLTLSGVVWGTFSIVLLVAFGDGVKRSQRKTMHGMGEGIVIVWPGATTMVFEGFTKGKAVRVTPETVNLLKLKIDDIKRISPEFVSRKSLRYKKEEFTNTVRGVNVEFERMRNTIPEKGRFLNQIDIAQKRRVCFLGDRIAEDLFHDEESVGKKIFIQGIPFTVIGVMVPKLQGSNYSGQRDQFCAMIPYTTFSSLFGEKFVNNFIFQPWEPENSENVILKVREYLSNKIGFSPADEDALFVWDYTELERSLNIFFAAFSIFLGMMGSFTLLVGGVGVASIMMVVVEERTKEIGVKLAVGAKKKQILLQFFSESLAIILMGGVLGFSLAAFVLKIIPTERIEDYVGIPEMNFLVGITTIVVLLIIGGISGIMPAKRAASTNPIHALRD